MSPSQNFHPRIRFAAVVLASLTSAALPNEAQASAGHLDSSFGIGGKVLTEFNGHGDGGWGVALQSDDKNVVAGDSYSGTDAVTDDFALARYNADGTLDPTFGIGGKVTTDFEANEDVASAVAIQADDKIVAAGRSECHRGLRSSHNSDGSPTPVLGLRRKKRTIFPAAASLVFTRSRSTKIVAAGRVTGLNTYDCVADIIRTAA